jgi:hypothetical protein
MSQKKIGEQKVKQSVQHKREDLYLGVYMSDLSQSWECVAELVGHSSWIYGVPILTG